MEDKKRVIAERLTKLIRDLVETYGESWTRQCVVIANFYSMEEAEILAELLHGAQIVSVLTTFQVMLGNVDNYKLCRDFEDDYPSFMDLGE